MSDGTDVAVRGAAQETIAQIRGDRFREQLELALPPNVTVGRFTRATVTALLQNPEVADANRDSLFQSVIRCAQDGLMPDGHEAALVIFNQKVKTAEGEHWEKRVQYMPMIGGFRKIAAEHGWQLEARVVYANDKFDYQLGLAQRLEHYPARIGHERGDRIGAYAIAKHRDGRTLFDVLSADEVEQARKVSRAADRGPWVEWTDRMWEKTAGRRLFGRLALADEDRVVRLIDASEISDPIGSLYGPGAGGDVGTTRPALGPGSPAPTIGVDESANGSAAPSSDASVADNQGAGDAPTAVAAPDLSGEPEDEPAETTPEEEDEIKAWAQKAAKVKVHFGNKQGRTLGQIYEGGRSAGWFRWLLGVAGTPPFQPVSEADQKLVRAGLAFCRLQLKDVYQEALGARETSS